MSPVSDADLVTRIEAQLRVERAWAYDRHVHEGLPFAVILQLAMRPHEHGGIGRALSWQTLRGMIDEQRAEQGTPFGDRMTRLERRQYAYDGQVARAREAIRRAAEVGLIDHDAEKLLERAYAAEAKMHGDDAAQRVDVEVTNRDALVDELNAELIALGESPIREDAS